MWNCGIFGALAAVTALCMLAGCSPAGGREPSTGGHLLREWARLHASTDPASTSHTNAADAIRQIGTNGIPFLTQWISEAHAPTLRASSDEIDIRALAAAAAFSALQSDGAAAIPELTRFLNQGSDLASAYAAQALGRIGAPGLPVMIAALGNPRPAVRKNAADFMIFMGQTARPAIPALQKMQNDPDPEVTKSVTFILGVLTNTPAK